MSRIDTHLVMGATGKTGRRVVANLLRSGQPVKAASRSAAVTFDWTDNQTWAEAVKGAATAYLIAPGEVEPVRRFVDEAVAGGVRKFVCLSGRAVDQFPAGSFDGMRAAEEAIQNSGVEWTILRANNFNQNFDEDLWQAPLTAGHLALPMDSTPEPFIDVHDIADVASVVLTSDGHNGKVYDLSGPEGLSFAQAVSIMAAAAGREMTYEEISPAAYRDQLLSEGWPAEAAEEINALFGMMRAGHYSERGRGVQEVLGREPRGFVEFAVDAAARGAWG